MTSYEHKVKNIYLGWRYYAWYPLTEDANDISWNNHITTSWATSYGSDGAVFPDSNHNWLLIPFNIDYSQNWTISFYTKINTLNKTSSHSDSRILDLYATNNRIDCRVEDFMETSSHFPWKYCVMKNNNYSSPIYNSDYTSGTWMYICLTINNWTVKAYKNWILSWTTTVTWTTNYFRFWNEYNLAENRHIYWNIKDIIIDNKDRSDEEIENYFDSTRSDYWIVYEIIFPQMSSDSEWWYTATSSSLLNSSYHPYFAFYNWTWSMITNDPVFHSSKILAWNTAYSMIQCPNSIQPTKIKIASRVADNQTNQRPIRAFTLQWSNDWTNFTDIITQTWLQNSRWSYSTSNVLEWDIANSSRYTYFKLIVTANDNYVAFNYWNIDWNI
jgi:hypothetical protein